VKTKAFIFYCESLSFMSMGLDPSHES